MSFRDKLRKARDIKKCPRCGEKYIKGQERCSDCGLIFSRLELASNKVAKRQLMHFDYDYVVYTKDLPKDVKRWKLILYVIFLGLVGGHYFYVGKFGKAITMCVGFVYLIVCTILNPILAAYMEANYLFVPIGIYAMAWIVSLIFVLSRKFKVPVMIDSSVLEEEVNKKRADFDRLKKDLKTENEKLKKEKEEKTENQKKPTNIKQINNQYNKTNKKAGKKKGRK